MASLKIYTRNRGFTLIEILVVMGLCAVVSTFALMVSMDWYRASVSHSDRDTLVLALEHARLESMHNVCLGDACTGGKPHGVAVRPEDNQNAYVIFQGSTYAARDVAVDVPLEANPTVATSGLTEVVFAQVSGDVSSVGDLVLTGAGRVSTITVGSEGQIFWSQ